MSVKVSLRNVNSVLLVPSGVTAFDVLMPANAHSLLHANRYMLFTSQIHFVLILMSASCR